MLTVHIKQRDSSAMKEVRTMLDHATASAITARIGAQLRQRLTADEARLPATLENLLTALQWREAGAQRKRGEPDGH